MAAPNPAPSPAPPTRPRGQWRGLEPLRPVVATTKVSAAEPLGFVRTLPSRWQVPPAVAPLGHDVTVTAPAARVPVAGAPVGGYPDPPELVWAALPPAVEGPADPGPRLPSPDAPPIRTDLPVPGPDRPLDPGAAGPGPAAPVAVAATATASTPPRPSSRPLAGTRESLPARRFRPAEGVGTPMEPTGPPEVAPGPVAAQGHRASAPTDVVADGPRRPVLDLGETGTAAAPGRAEAGEDAGAVPPGPGRRVVLPEAPTGHPAAGPAVPPALPPAEPSAGEPGAPVGPRPVPSPTVLQARPVVGLRPALVTARSRGTAAAQDVATAAPAPGGPALHEHVTPPLDAPTGPGTGVPEWFSSGPIRTVLPEPDAVAAAEPRAAAPAPAPLPSAPRRQPPQGEVTPLPPARVAAAAVPHAPRRVAWPAPAAPDSPLAAASAGDEDDDPTAPHDAVDVADGGPAVDLDAPVASRRDPAQPEAPSRLRPDTTAAPTPPSPAAARPRTDAAPIAAGPRRFRVGAPLPRPAPARAPVQRSGLAELAAAAMAAVAHEPGADTAPRAGRRADAPDLAAGGTPPPRGLLPSDLGLPGRADTPSAPTATTVSDARDEDEDEDDLGPAAGPSIDEIYEQVRDRLRHELVVDRERAALLAD